MKAEFFELAGRLERALQAGEVLLLGLDAERSDFVRFNRGRVRQAGSVEQRTLEVRLLRAGRQASATLELGGGGEADFALARDALARLREALDGLPEDPWLLINEVPASSESERRGVLPAAEAVVEQVVDAAQGRDLVGIYAGGTILRGFANSLGQRNWHSVDSFNFDWSLHGPGGAVKAATAGFEWEESALVEKLDAASRELARLGVAPRALAPGEVRAYLAPRALEELMGLLAWDGFSARARATKQSPLLRMAHGALLSPAVTIVEHSAEGIAPSFQEDGFVKPPALTLIEGGRLGAALVAPRTAKEYGLEPNGAEAGESPESLELAPGTLPAQDVLAALDTGLYISNLWYLNYSDRAAARITGMTRFATFWVEGGRIVAPVGAMRFDDSLYRMLGENLEALTRERELLLDPSTYEGRSTASARLPGALLRALRFTL